MSNFWVATGPKVKCSYIFNRIALNTSFTGSVLVLNCCPFAAACCWKGEGTFSLSQHEMFCRDASNFLCFSSKCVTTSRKCIIAPPHTHTPPPPSPQSSSHKLCIMSWAFTERETPTSLLEAIFRITLPSTPLHPFSSPNYQQKLKIMI